MATYNRITLLGNVAAEIRSSINGNATDIYLAVNGTRENDSPLFINVRTFNNTAQFAQKYLRKGSTVLVDGRLVLETYTDRNGKEQKKYSVMASTLQLLNSGNRNEAGQHQQQQRPQQQAQSFQQSSCAEDDYPF